MLRLQPVLACLPAHPTQHFPMESSQGNSGTNPTRRTGPGKGQSEWFQAVGWEGLGGGALCCQVVEGASPCLQAPLKVGIGLLGRLDLWVPLHKQGPDSHGGGHGSSLACLGGVVSTLWQQPQHMEE